MMYRAFGSSDSLIAFQNLHNGILTANYDGTNGA
jgi:hypothetical protein